MINGRDITGNYLIKIMCIPTHYTWPIISATPGKRNGILNYFQRKLLSKMFDVRP